MLVMKEIERGWGRELGKLNIGRFKVLVSIRKSFISHFNILYSE